MKVVWETERLSDVCREITDGSHFSPKTIGKGYPYVTVRDIEGDQIDFGSCKYISKADFTQLLNNGCKPNKGDILFSKDGTVGKVALVNYEKDFVVLSSLAIVRPDSRRIDSAFLKYVMQSPDFLREAVGKKTGVAIRRIILRNLKSIHVPVPPLAAQRRIVNVLDQAIASVATAKANAESNLQNARALTIPAFMEILSSLDQSRWRISTVEEVANHEKGSVRTGPFGSQLLHGEFVKEGIPVLGIDNVVQNRFAWNERRYITPQKFLELARYQVRPGDVLISIMGTCGRCAIVPNDIPTAINSAHLCCITLDRQKCLPEFLHAYFLYHPAAHQFLASKAKGAIMAGLNMGIIKELPLTLPPIEQQRRVVAKIAQLTALGQNLETLYHKKLRALNELKESILHSAFSAQL